jgi:hypothetical protein
MFDDGDLPADEPLCARRASDSLLRSYVVSLRLLTILSLPIAMSVTFLARRWSSSSAARNI